MNRNLNRRLRSLPINSLSFRWIVKSCTKPNYFFGNTFCGITWDGFPNQMFSKNWQLTWNKMEKKNSWDLRNGDLERSGKASCGIQSPEYQELGTTAVSSHLVTLEWQRPKMWMDLVNKVGGNHYLRHVDHRSTLHEHEQDRIFHIHVRVDM